VSDCAPPQASSDTVLLGAVGYLIASVSGGITSDGFELKGGPSSCG